ncbi:MAG: hypothetical protein A2998_01880 [Candidatus Staskawiczbacteria bacterium RIFCSPLOWO2_01_FULL_37_25b]|uniref:Uncharacterized protein n=2 Tax=Candidatus Staskawicziibacteriota TaxID=1817916 RepID=A0A1G2HRC8_9BACT|nr:MAG: hypothetical protein A2812_01385 [Candidatus Staskawiczbacteria bacterium RIFCSPHIGHO2_01_FULL_36_16]OGZ74349.1 MAG: hypothetical protein A2998_01880 [Candidatus Staskawiczbacteria bacterium RIFCSPLOWO2_01_FULL_37_25b]
MLDDKDIQKLMEVLATKDDVKEIKEDLNGLREMVQSLVIAVDNLVKAVSDLSQEYTMISSKVDRHEKWLHQVAEKLGIKLEY